MNNHSLEGLDMRTIDGGTTEGESNQKILDRIELTGSHTLRNGEILIKKPEGQKHDQGKPQWNLLPWVALAEVVEVLTFGAVKYAPENWRHVADPINRYSAAALRHISAFMRGEERDPETGLHHLAHATCCLLFLLELLQLQDADGE